MNQVQITNSPRIHSVDPYKPSPALLKQLEEVYQREPENLLYHAMMSNEVFLVSLLIAEWDVEKVKGYLLDRVLGEVMSQSCVLCAALYMYYLDEIETFKPFLEMMWGIPKDEMLESLLTQIQSEVDDAS